MANHPESTGGDDPLHRSPVPEAATMPLERLEAEIITWAGHLAAAEAHWLALIAEFDRRKGWSQWGMASCAHWISWKCALSPTAARERVRVARALDELPLVRAAFGCGELSYSKVRAVCRVATEETESELLELARNTTASQLERFVSAWKGLLDKHLDDTAAEQHRRRNVQYRYDDCDGSLVGSFRIRADDAPAFVRELHAHTPRTATRAERDAGIDIDTIGQRRADALVSMALASHGASAAPGHQRTLVSVEVAADGTNRLEGGPAISSATAERLCCDATIVVGDAAPTTAIPRATRRAVRRRDGGVCTFPGCDHNVDTDAHHIVPRGAGGSHKLSNLTTLCRRHHHLVHEGGFGLERRGGDLVFSCPDGRAIPSVADRPTAELDSATGDRRGLAATALLDRNGGAPIAGGIGERLDLHYAVWVYANKPSFADSAETWRHRHGRPTT